MKIGFLLNYPELETWLHGELKDAPFRFEFHSKQSDAFVVCAVDEKQAKEYMEIFQLGKPIYWIGVDSNVAESKGALGVQPFEDDDEPLDPDLLIKAAHWLFEHANHQNAACTENTDVPKRPLFRIPTSSDNQTSNTSSVAEAMSTFQRHAVRDYLIAVGGFSGCGSSTVAWNLAHCLEASLIEGQNSGSSLSKWTGDNTSVSHAIRQESSFGTVLESPFTDDTLLQITAVTVVDIGSDTSHPAWLAAKNRIWVTSVDPQWQGLIPEANRLVVNRVPEGWPVDLNEIDNRSVDLVIPDRSHEFFLACYKKRPWIANRPLEIQNEWSKLVGRSSKDLIPQREESITSW